MAEKIRNLIEDLHVILLVIFILMFVFGSQLEQFFARRWADVPTIEIEYNATPAIKEWVVKPEIRNIGKEPAKEMKVTYKSDTRFLDFIWEAPDIKMEGKAVGGKGKDHFHSPTILNFSISDEPIRAKAVLQGDSEYLTIRVRADNLYKETYKEVKLSQQFPELQDP